MSEQREPTGPSPPPERSSPFGNFWSDLGKTGERMVIHGASELANALYNGSAFVPYGPGVDTREHGTQVFNVYGQSNEQEVEQNRTREGLGR